MTDVQKDIHTAANDDRLELQQHNQSLKHDPPPLYAVNVLNRPTESRGSDKHGNMFSPSLMINAHAVLIPAHSADMMK